VKCPIEGRSSIRDVTLSNFVANVAVESSLPAFVASLRKVRGLCPGRDPIGSKRDVLIEQIRGSMCELNEAPIPVLGLKMSRQWPEIRLIATGICTVMRDNPDVARWWLKCL